VAREVGAFYERHPYPPPVDDLEPYRKLWTDARRRADAHLFWPHDPYRDDRTILVAGCGTSQAARHAMRWPRAKVVGIDVSSSSIESTERLKRKYGLDNLVVHQLPVERAADLGRSFEHIVCTGVLHHLPDPDTGLRALHDVLEPDGAMHLMVYAPYGRAGVYLLQDYCRRLGIGATTQEIKALAQSVQAIPPDHPLMPVLRNAPDFGNEAALADALLHPCDRAYSVPQLLQFMETCGFGFGRWIEQAAYLPHCGVLASTPHHPLLARLPPPEQYAAVELFRGSMIRHSAVLYRSDRPHHETISFKGDAWLGYVPVRVPDTIMVQERLPPGAAAVLINRHHTYTDLYLPINQHQKQLVDSIDGKKSIGEMTSVSSARDVARVLFEGLWRYDQVVFDLSRDRPGD
jgi:SAM-dependent methyltransferase